MHGTVHAFLMIKSLVDSITAFPNAADLNTNAQSQPEDPIKAVKVLRVAACPW